MVEEGGRDELLEASCFMNGLDEEDVLVFVAAMVAVGCGVVGVEVHMEILR